MDHALIEKEIVEIFHDGRVRKFDTQVQADLLRQQPIVVPASLVFIVLD